MATLLASCTNDSYCGLVDWSVGIQRRCKLCVSASGISMSQPNKVDRHRIEEMNDMRRAGGGVVCEHCGFPYYDHPKIVGYEWLTKICNGDIVKL